MYGFILRQYEHPNDTQSNTDALLENFFYTYSKVNQYIVLSQGSCY